MWEYREFKTQAALDKFIEKHGHKIQYEIIYINNSFGIEYRKLRRVG